MEKAIIYKGDSFKALIRQYSNSRMEVDRDYRSGVLSILKERATKPSGKPAPPRK